MKLFKKIITIIIILELALILGPWLVFVPAISDFFSEEFGSTGWIYSILGLVSLVVTLLVYAAVNFFDPMRKQENLKVSKVNRISNRIAWTLIIGLLAFWALAILGVLN